MKKFIRRHNVILSLAVTIIWFAVTVLISNVAFADETEGFCDCSISEEASNDVICHVPPGNHKNMHTIRVGAPAIHAHLEHGDMLGPCPGDDTNSDDRSEDSVVQSLSACECDDGTTGTWYHAPSSTPAEASSLRNISGQ